MSPRVDRAAIEALPLRAAVSAMPVEVRGPREAKLTGIHREVYLARRDGQTLAEIGRRHDRTREWARQVELAALVAVVGGVASAKEIVEGFCLDDEIVRLSHAGLVAARIARDLRICPSRVMLVLSRVGRDPASLRAQRVEAVMRRLSRDETHAKIAESLGVSAGTVAAIASKVGLPGRGGRRRSLPHCDRRRESVRALLAEGLTTREIAESLGVTTHQVKWDRARIARSHREGQAGSAPVDRRDAYRRQLAAEKEK